MTPTRPAARSIVFRAPAFSAIEALRQELFSGKIGT